MDNESKIRLDQDGMTPMQQLLSQCTADENLVSELFSRNPDYYWRLRIKAEMRCKPYYQLIAGLNRLLPRVNQRLEDEKRNQNEIAGRLAQMKSTDNNYKGLQTELQGSVGICNNIETNILPAAEVRLETATRDLLTALNVLAAEARTEADNEVKQILRDCLNERQAFIAGCVAIFRDYGLPFVIEDESFCPGPFSAADVREFRIKLGMDAVSEPVVISETEIAVIQTEADEPPKPAEPISEPFGEPDEPVGANND